MKTIYKIPRDVEPDVDFYHTYEDDHMKRKYECLSSLKRATDEIVDMREPDEQRENTNVATNGAIGPVPKDKKPKIKSKDFNFEGQPFFDYRHLPVKEKTLFENAKLALHRLDREKKEKTIDRQKTMQVERRDDIQRDLAPLDTWTSKSEADRVQRIVLLRRDNLRYCNDLQHLGHLLLWSCGYVSLYDDRLLEGKQILSSLIPQKETIAREVVKNRKALTTVNVSDWVTLFKKSKSTGYGIITSINTILLFVYDITIRRASKNVQKYKLISNGFFNNESQPIYDTIRSVPIKTKQNTTIEFLSKK